MSGFLFTTLVVLAIFLAFATPLAIAVAVRRPANRAEIARNHTIAVALLALLSGAVRYGGDRLVSQCGETGANPNRCNDFGGSGMVAMFVGLYAVVALIRAWQVARA